MGLQPLPLVELSRDLDRALEWYKDNPAVKPHLQTMQRALGAARAVAPEEDLDPHVVTGYDKDVKGNDHEQPQ